MFNSFIQSIVCPSRLIFARGDQKHIRSRTATSEEGGGDEEMSFGRGIKQITPQEVQQIENSNEKNLVREKIIQGLRAKNPTSTHKKVEK